MKNIQSTEKVSFWNKYHSPRVLQALTTLAFILLLLAMRYVIVFDLFQTNYKGYFNYHGTSIPYRGRPWKNCSVLEIISESFGGYVIDESYLFDIVLIITCLIVVAGITFIWMNRPKHALICGSALFFLIIVSYICFFLGSCFKEKFFRQYHNEGFDMKSELYEWYLTLLLLAAVALLVVFLILSIKMTKAGARPPKTVRVVESKVSESQVSQKPSSADELKKYKELLDLGAITQDEYNEKKKQLLGLVENDQQ